MAPLSAILRHVRRLASDGQPECPDAALLDRFTRTRDEAAFEELVHRHGAMVWGVCNRLLRDRHAAEDAFQATFLVLARRAGSIRRPSSLGCWLYGVARRVAGKLRRPPRVGDVDEVPVADPSLPPLERVSGRELVALLDEELGRLPERLRAPLVLCYLEGRLREEAAKELGWTLGQVKQRLEEGRAVLRTRLARRGVGLPGALLSAALVENVGSGATPAGLAATTVRVATAFASGAAAAAGPAVATADAVVRAMALSRLKWAAAVLLAAGTFAVGAGLAQRRAPADNAVAARPDDTQPPAAVQPAARVDQFGDPLPEQALARLGTLRFRHDVGLISVAASPDGKLIAGGGGKCVILWDAATGQVVRNLPGDDIRTQDGTTYSIGFGSVAFSPDGTKLAGGIRLYSNVTAPIYVWDVATGRELRRLEGYPGSAHDVAFVDGGKSLVSFGGTDEPGRTRGPVTVKQWDLATGSVVRTYEGHPGRPSSLAVSPDGTLLTVGFDTPEGKDAPPAAVWAWDVTTGAKRYGRDLTTKAVRSLTFSPDGRRVALLDGPSIALLDPATGDELRRWNGPAEGERVARFTPDGATLLTAGPDTKVRVWDVATGRELRSIETGQRPTTHLVLSDRNTLLTFAFTGVPHFWDLTTGKEVRRVEGHDRPLTVVGWSPDGRTAVTESSGDSSIRTWDPRTGRELPRSAEDILRKWLLATGSDPKPRFQEAIKGRDLPALRDRRREPDVLTVSPDGLTAAVSPTYEIHLFDVTSGQPIRKWRAHESSLTELVFSPDGRLLASGAYDLTIALWDVATGQELVRANQRASVYGLSFAPDGRVLATGCDLLNGNNNRVRLWDVGTGRELAALTGHRSRVYATAFSPDGRLLLSGSADQSALVWDVAGITHRPPTRLNDADRDRLWDDLAGDAKTGHRAVYELLAAGPDAIAAFTDRLQPATAGTPALDKLLTDLGDERFATREEATRALQRLGPAAEAALRKALEAKPPAEVRCRIERLLDRLLGDESRHVRAVEVLEKVGTAEARQQLRRLAGGAPGARPTREAKAALERLERPSG